MYYRDYASFLADHFPGEKIQKLTVDAGNSCPNRDGTIGRGGCVYCNNSSFSPILTPGSDTGKTVNDTSGGRADIRAQLERSRAFFARKYPKMRYLAYFQSYTNTHGDVDALLRLYDEALETEGVVGIVIGTRPDCLPVRLLDALAERRARGRWIMVELGAESTHDCTLARVNRCHTWQCTVDAVKALQARGIPVGLHFIMGLPGETREMMMQSVERLCALGVDTVKFHQLQIIAGSAMALQWERGERPQLFTPGEYLDLCVDIVQTIRRLQPTLAIDRFTSQAPEGLLIAPKWGLKNYQFVNLLHQRLKDARCHP